MTAAVPSGVVTFLFTDVEGSTRRWESDADVEGFLFSHTGDGGSLPVNVTACP
jgi:hypothetical protein